MLAVVGLAGCAPADADADAEREPAAATCGLGPLPAPGETRTVLEGDDLREGASIGVGAVLADGSVVVSYDLNPIDENDEEAVATEEPEPGLLHLREDSCEPVPLPTVDGQTVAADAFPVAADDEGRLYLFERPALRLVRGTPGADDWATVVVVPSEQLRFGYAPGVSVSDTGDVFVGFDFLVSRVTATGELEPLVGTGEGDGQVYPLPDPGTFPRPATSAPVTKVSGIAATPSGTLAITSFQTVMEWDPPGTLRLLANPETTAGQEGAIQKRTFTQNGGEIGSFIGGPNVTDAGDILLGEYLGADDPADIRNSLLAIRNGRSTVLAELEDFMSPNPGSALFPGDAAILLRDGGRSLALYGLPAA
jgi:hypothetical protein